MPKYHVSLESGRDFILESSQDLYELAWEAYNEACLSDDYLADIVLINDV